MRLVQREQDKEMRQEMNSCGMTNVEIAGINIRQSFECLVSQLPA
jgi:hypothetical protein